MKLQPENRRSWIKLLLAGGISGLITTLVLFGFPAGNVYAQQPTGSIATVTGTPRGIHITVYSDQKFIDIYAGPSSYNYDRIGILASGEEASALGYSQDGNWIEIRYIGVPGGKGWVYAPFVSISPGSLPVIISPPTATPRTTPTLDPTYVAAFGLELEPTHLPTFTQPPALEIVTFEPETSNTTKIPYGFIILGLAMIGILGAMISFLRGSR
jgi:hypothetical protein